MTTKICELRIGNIGIEIAALARRDQTLAAEVRAYREVVTGIATSPDARKQRALQRFAAGEQREALADLDVIADADRAARLKAADIADAANRRPTAELALQADDLGKVTLEEVVARYEQLTRLDPGVALDWLHLGRLYDEQGRLEDARKAARSGYASLTPGTDERARAALLADIAAIAFSAGDLAGARARFEESLAIARRLAGADPSSAQAQRDLGLVLDQLGGVAIDAGDLAGARARCEESLIIRQKLARDNPTSAQAQRDLGAALSELGDIAIQAGDLPRAKARFEAYLAITRKLARDNPTSTQAQRDLSISIERLGDVAVQAGDLPGARARFEESLANSRKLGDVALQGGDLKSAGARFEESLVIRTRLAEGNPTSAAAQTDLASILDRLGIVALESGDLQGARTRFEANLVITRKLAQLNPSSAEAQRDLVAGLDRLGDLADKAGDAAGARARYAEALVIVRKLAQANPSSADAQHELLAMLFKLGRITRDRTLMTEALELARELDRAGRLAPDDRPVLDAIPVLIRWMP